MAIKIAERLEDIPAATTLVDLVSDRLGNEHPLTGALRRGVAFHNAALSGEVQEALEDALRDGTLRYVVATTTLTEGVNLPVRTVVLFATPEGNEWSRELTPNEIINAVGRAGRACIESEGWAVLARNGPPTEDDFGKLDPDRDDISTLSQLAAESSLDALAKFESLLAESSDAILNSALSIVSDFISFVWLISTVSDELGRLHSAEDLVDALQSTLAWQQLSEGAQRRWMTLAGEVKKAYVDSDPIARRRWARVSMSVGSAKSLDELSRLVAEAALDADRDMLAEPKLCLRFLDDLGVVEAVRSRPESQDRTVYDRQAAPRSEVEFNLVDLAHDWMSGTPVAGLGERHFEAIEDLAYRLEQVGRVREWIEHYLAWGVSTVVNWANDRLAAQGSGQRVCPELGSYLRHGVDSQVALGLLRSGMRSRRLAVLVAQEFDREAEATNRLVTDWIAALGLQALRERFDATATDLSDLLDIVRAPDRVVGEVLAGRVAAVPLEGYVEVGAERAQLVHSVEDQVDRILVVREDDESGLGRISIEYQADVDILIRTGVPVKVQSSDRQLEPGRPRSSWTRRPRSPAPAFRGRLDRHALRGQRRL